MLMSCVYTMPILDIVARPVLTNSYGAEIVYCVACYQWLASVLCCGNQTNALLVPHQA